MCSDPVELAGPMSDRFATPKSALVTGASRGIGAALARATDPATHLVLTGRDEAALREVADTLGKDGRRVQCVVADLTSEADLGRIVEAAEAAEIDLLINNAGVGQVGPFLEVELPRHIEALQVNLAAPIQLTHRLVPGMLRRAQASGRHCGLINLGSTAGFAPVPKFAVYAASKAMMYSWSSALAEELRGEPIHILTALPGATQTSFGQSAGFGSRTIPGARDADKVAREIIRALGKQSIIVTDTTLLPTEIPLRMANRLLTGLVGRATRALTK